jgi:hypothetical protein
MDALHEGLERNPFDEQEHGLVLKMRDGGSASISSLGYADDTAALAGSLPALRMQNDWVHYFMAFNQMRLNPSKCELVGRGADGQCVTAVAVAAAGISIHGQSLVPVPHHKPIRYLGVHCCFDGSWEAQKLRSLSMIQLFTRVVSKFRLPLNQASYMFNTFLLPKLELALRYVSGPSTTAWLKKCDAILVGSMKHAAASPLCLSHSAVALSLRFTLPSWLETAVKVSELFLRMNSITCRWSVRKPADPLAARSSSQGLQQPSVRLGRGENIDRDEEKRTRSPRRLAKHHA